MKVNKARKRKPECLWNYGEWGLEPIFLCFTCGEISLLQKCKHERKEKGGMTRCCLCALWYHEDCVGITSHEEHI